MHAEPAARRRRAPARAGRAARAPRSGRASAAGCRRSLRDSAARSRRRACRPAAERIPLSPTCAPTTQKMPGLVRDPRDPHRVEQPAALRDADVERAARLRSRRAAAPPRRCAATRPRSRAPRPAVGDAAAARRRPRRRRAARRRRSGARACARSPRRPRSGVQAQFASTRRSTSWPSTCAAARASGDRARGRRRP